MAETSLAILDKATQMLAQVKTIDDAKGLMDMAAAAKVWAQKHKLGKEAVGHAHEIEISAEIKLGELLAAMPKHPGGNPNQAGEQATGNHYEPVACVPARLEDLGISKVLSAESQALAKLPEPIKEEVKKGKKSKKKAIKEAAPKKTGRIVTEVESDPVSEPKPILRIQAGDVIQLGRHRLYVTDNTDAALMQELTRMAPFALAFADPPYNANVAEWDDGAFVWQQDYLADLARVVCVTPGIGNIPGFMRQTAMPYKWSLSTYITNGMTRGAYGFGNWIYTAVFSKESVWQQSGDFAEITISNADASGGYQKRQKPLPYLEWLLELNNVPRDGLVLDAFSGSGAMLIVCERTGRRCIAVERDIESASLIVARYMAETGIEAEILSDAYAVQSSQR